MISGRRQNERRRTCAVTPKRSDARFLCSAEMNAPALLALALAIFTLGLVSPAAADLMSYFEFELDF